MLVALSFVPIIHYSQVVNNRLDKKDKGEPFYAKSAYCREKQIVAKKGTVNCVYKKRYRANPLTEGQELSNTEKSKIRAGVEHIFVVLKNSRHRMNLQFIGFKRINSAVALINLTCSMFVKIDLKTDFKERVDLC